MFMLWNRALSYWLPQQVHYCSMHYGHKLRNTFPLDACTIHCVALLQLLYSVHMSTLTCYSGFYVQQYILCFGTTDRMIIAHGVI